MQVDHSVFVLFLCSLRVLDIFCACLRDHAFSLLVVAGEALMQKLVIGTHADVSHNAFSLHVMVFPGMHLWAIFGLGRFSVFSLHVVA